MTDTFYADGGYGYDKFKSTQWARKHYRDDFGLDNLGNCPTLLDAGCGDGFWTAIFAELGFSATGVDRSTDAITTAKEKWPGPRYLLRDLESPLQDEGSFDIVFCRAIAPSAYPQSERNLRIMRNLAAVLRHGGVLLFSRSSNLSGEPLRSKLTGDPAPQPKLSEFVSMVESAGLIPYRCTVIGDMVQVGAWKP